MGHIQKNNKESIYFGILLILSAIIIISLASCFPVNAQGNESGNYTGNESNQSQSNISLPYVDPQIEVLFQNQTLVKIMIVLKDTTGISITQTDTKEQQGIKKEAKTAIFNNTSRLILSNFSEMEFELDDIFISGRQFYGHASKDGFLKLAQDPRIAEIYVTPQVLYTTPLIKRDFNKSENISIEEPPENKSVMTIEKDSGSIFTKFINFCKTLFKKIF